MLGISCHQSIIAAERGWNALTDEQRHNEAALLMMELARNEAVTQAEEAARVVSEQVVDRLVEGMTERLLEKIAEHDQSSLVQVYEEGEDIVAECGAMRVRQGSIGNALTALGQKLRAER